MLTTDSTYVGNAGIGSFTQTGGTHNTGVLTLAADPGSEGTYMLNGGIVTASGFEYIGLAGAGAFNQTGGTHTATYLHIGESAGGSGAYLLSAGRLNIDGDLRVALAGFGSFSQSDGTTIITGNNLYNTIGLGVALSSPWF